MARRRRGRSSEGVLWFFLMAAVIVGLLSFTGIGQTVVKRSSTFVTNVVQDLGTGDTPTPFTTPSGTNGTIEVRVKAEGGSNWNCLTPSSPVNITVNNVLLASNLSQGIGTGSERTWEFANWTFPIGSIVWAQVVIDTVGTDTTFAKLLSSSFLKLKIETTVC